MHRASTLSPPSSSSVLCRVSIHGAASPQWITIQNIDLFNRRVIILRVVFSDIANGPWEDTEHGDHSQFFKSFFAGWQFNASIRSGKTNSFDLAGNVEELNSAVDGGAEYSPGNQHNASTQNDVGSDFEPTPPSPGCRIGLRTYTFSRRLGGRRACSKIAPEGAKEKLKWGKHLHLKPFLIWWRHFGVGEAKYSTSAEFRPTKALLHIG